MLPAPPSTAAPPRARSRPSWNPAEPPPPVAGAAVGNGLADGLGVTVGVGVGVGVADPLGDGLGLALAEWLSVPLGEADAVGVGVLAGENEDEAAEGVPAEQAEIATEAQQHLAMALKPVMVSIALSPAPAMVVRTLMDPPSIPARWRPCFPFSSKPPVPAMAGDTRRPGRRPCRPKTDSLRMLCRP